MEICLGVDLKWGRKGAVGICAGFYSTSWEIRLWLYKGFYWLNDGVKGLA
jgi:hypothetical protein